MKQYLNINSNFKLNISDRPEYLNRKSLHAIIITLQLCLIISCAMSPGARMVQKGTLEIGGQASLMMTDDLGGSSILPNIGLNAKYGVTDKINIGANLYPLHLPGFKCIYSEPFFSVSLLSKKIPPAFITYLELPTAIDIGSWDVLFLPQIGFVLNYQFPRYLPYIGYELSFYPGAEIKYNNIHSNGMIGISYQTERKNWVSLEMSLNNIAPRETYLLIQFGASFPVIKKREISVD